MLNYVNLSDIATFLMDNAFWIDDFLSTNAGISVASTLNLVDAFTILSFFDILTAENVKSSMLVTNW